MMKYVENNNEQFEILKSVLFSFNFESQINKQDCINFVHKLVLSSNLSLEDIFSKHESSEKIQVLTFFHLLIKRTLNLEIDISMFDFYIERMIHTYQQMKAEIFNFGQFN